MKIVIALASLLVALMAWTAPTLAADLKNAPAVPPSPRTLPSLGPPTGSFSWYKPQVPVLTEMPQFGINFQPTFPQVTTHTLWPASWYPATGRTVWCPSLGVMAHCF
jgi:hypothetical protein